MLLLLYLVTAGLVSAQDANCTTFDSTQGTFVFSPTATVCSDTISTSACAQLFAITTVITPGMAFGNRSAGCYAVTTPAPATPSADVQNAAIAECPSSCGYCCMTPAYNCPNAPNPTIDCSTITSDMCQSTQWRSLIATNCPSACGFCELGGCVDVAPDCSTQPTICSNSQLTSFVAANCQRTCGLCSSATTVSSIASSTTCGDTNTNCANWVANGFCSSTFYTSAQKASYCGASCGLCSGKK